MANNGFDFYVGSQITLGFVAGVLSLLTGNNGFGLWNACAGLLHDRPNLNATAPSQS